MVYSLQYSSELHVSVTCQNKQKTALDLSNQDSTGVAEAARYLEPPPMNVAIDRRGSYRTGSHYWTAHRGTTGIFGRPALSGRGDELRWSQRSGWIRRRSVQPVALSRLTLPMAGALARMVVPCPGFDSIASVPFTSCSLSRILISPRPRACMASS